MRDGRSDVRRQEHPRGDPLRTHGPQKNGQGLWWKQLSRNKECVTLDLSVEPGQEILQQLAARADVLIESFRPGVMERWNLDPERLAERNRGLLMLRVSG